MPNVSLYERAEYFNVYPWTSARKLSLLLKGTPPGYNNGGKYVPLWGGANGYENFYQVPSNLPISLSSLANATKITSYPTDAVQEYLVLNKDVYDGWPASWGYWEHWRDAGGSGWYTGSGETRIWPGPFPNRYNNYLSPPFNYYYPYGCYLPNGLTIEGLIGAYIGESFNPSTNIWHDLIGNVDIKMNGSPYARRDSSINNRIVVNGGTGTNATFFDGYFPSNYMVIHVARYNPTGSSRSRIFSTTNVNWLSGFWDNKQGVAYGTPNFVRDPYVINQDPYAWILTMHRNAGSGASYNYPRLTTYALNQQTDWQDGSWGYAPTVPTNVCINNDPYNEKSDFQVACLLVYDMNVFGGRDTYWNAFRPIENFYIH